MVFDHIQARLARSDVLSKLSGEAASANKTKYLKVEHWVGKMLLDASDVGIPGSRPLRILDIGTGPGYFPAICEHFGHSCMGLDRPGVTFYAALRASLGVEVVEHKILPMTPLPGFRHRFDMVTAFRTPFDIVRAEDRLFSAREWAFFLNDLRDNVLAPGGRLFMRMNKDYPFSDPPLDTPELRDLFESRGAAIVERTVSFDPLL